MPRKSCQIDGCTNFASARGWCSKHYQRWQKYGDALATPKFELSRAVNEDRCSVVGCDEVIRARGFCNRHYSRFMKSGDAGAADSLVPRRGSVDEPRTCTGCGETKDAYEFLIDSRRPDRRLSLCKRCRSARSKKALTLHRYGITPDAYATILSRQGGGCAVCWSTTRLCVDHCHETGRVRGILCNACNVALGRLEDDPARIERLANYVRTTY